MNRRTLLKGLFGGAIAGKAIADSKEPMKEVKHKVETASNGSYEFTHKMPAIKNSAGEELKPVYTIEHDMSDYKPICCQHRHIRAVYTTGQGMRVECADCGELKPCITHELNGGRYQILYDREII